MSRATCLLRRPLKRLESPAYRLVISHLLAGALELPDRFLGAAQGLELP